MSASPDPDCPIQTLQRVVVLATGGTIAGLRQHGGQPGYHAARLGIDAVMQAAGVSGLAGVQTEQLAQVDSKDMTHALWHALALRCATLLMQPDLAGLVITHGTDTMEETAWFLHRVLHAGKPVVLTGAMRPADAPDADGPANLHDALAVARHRSMGGVSAVMAGEVHGAHAVRKVHATSLRAFSSGARPLRARVTSGEIHDIEGPTAPGAHANTHDAAALPPAAQWPRVDIVVSHAGADGAICDACVQAGARGIVMATTGDNTLHEALEAAATRARAQGVVVVRARQVDGAGDDDRTSEAQGDKATAWTAPETATAPANVSPVKARIDLMLALMAAPAPAARSSPGASR